MIEEVKEMINKFLSGNYPPTEFSFDLPDVIVDNYDEIAKENEDVAKKLDDTFPEICAEYEQGDDPSEMVEKIKKAYNEIFTA